MPEADRRQPAVPAGAAVATWLAAWPVGDVLVGAVVIAAVGAAERDLTIGEMSVARLLGWTVFLVALVVTSRTSGTGDFAADYGVRFRPVDLVGLPAGVALQFGVLPVLYWPLAELWPDAFSSEEVEERARDLVDRAHGVWLWVLAAILVIGAPLVEELVYRGLLQRSIGSRLGRWQAWVVVSLWFALIHFSPVEYPGLFLAGLTFGLGVVLTGRIASGVLAHVGFNAAGLAAVLWWS